MEIVLARGTKILSFSFWKPWPRGQNCPTYISSQVETDPLSAVSSLLSRHNTFGFMWFCRCFVRNAQSYTWLGSQARSGLHNNKWLHWEKDFFFPQSQKIVIRIKGLTYKITLTFPLSSTWWLQLFSYLLNYKVFLLHKTTVCCKFRDMFLLSAPTKTVISTKVTWSFFAASLYNKGSQPMCREFNPASNSQFSSFQI